MVDASLHNHDTSRPAAYLDIQQVLTILQLVQLELKLEDTLLADRQVVLVAARADGLHVMRQVVLVHGLCRF